MTDIFPTVTLRHRRTGRLKIVNEHSLFDRLATLQDWTIVSQTRGDASTEELVRDAAEAELNRQRTLDRDMERARSSHAITLDGGDVAKALADTVQDRRNAPDSLAPTPARPRGRPRKHPDGVVAPQRPVPDQPA